MNAPSSFFNSLLAFSSPALQAGGYRLGFGVGEGAGL
jgi:hypothetical protein